MTKQDFKIVARQIRKRGKRYCLGGKNKEYNYYNYIEGDINYSLYDYNSHFSIIEVYSYSEHKLTTYKRNANQIIHEHIEYVEDKHGSNRSTH